MALLARDYTLSGVMRFRSLLLALGETATSSGTLGGFMVFPAVGYIEATTPISDRFRESL